MRPIILIHFSGIIEQNGSVSNLDHQPQFDNVRPGEQWFFYWKTSAALWEGRIAKIPQDELVLIPLYWGFHAESPTEWDFGRIRPEADLLRLVQILTQYRRRFAWIMPVTPAPFLTNGGIPAYSARTLSITREGTHLGVFDQDYNLNKIYSFFEPKVFHSYGDFLKNFGRVLKENRIEAPIWGGEFFYGEDGEVLSYIQDYSIAFERGFSRFLKQNTSETEELNDPVKEQRLKEEFCVEVAGLFKTSVEAAVGKNWKGTKRIYCLGGSPKETVLRSLPGGKSELHYTKDLINLFIHEEWPSSALLHADERKNVLSYILYNHFGHGAVDHSFKERVYPVDLSQEFRPYAVADLIGGKGPGQFVESGLTKFLNNQYRWLYSWPDRLDFTPTAIDRDHGKIKFFHGRDLNRATLGQILKLFMMGQRVLIDKSEMSEDLDKVLDVFLLENNLKGQSVNYVTSIQILELGDGRLVLFDGKKLHKNEDSQKFWGHLFKYLNLSEPELILDKDVYCLWSIRATGPNDLSYLDVRRLSIYNPTSYKKQVTVKTNKHFAFMRMTDPTRATAKTTPVGVDIELLPHGRIALDFGHYEET